MKFLFAALLLCLTISPPSLAQNSAGNANEPAVRYLRQIVDFDIYADGANLQTHDTAMLVLSAAGVQEAKATRIRATDSFGTTEVLEAYTIKKDGRRRNIAVLNPPTEKVIPPAQAVRLRDEKYRTLDFPDVEVGDTVVWNYRRFETAEVTAGRVYESLLFPQSKLYDDVVITVRAPADMRVLVNSTMLAAVPAAERADGRRESKWTFKNSKFVPGAPSADSPQGFPVPNLPKFGMGYMGSKATVVTAPPTVPLPPSIPGGRPLIVAEEVYYKLLQERRFDEIERAADGARTAATTVADGQPLLAAIYFGVVHCSCKTELTPREWEQHGQLLEEWRRARPNSSTAQIAFGGYQLARAWHIRGYGYADTVSREQWEGFAAEVAAAAATLGQMPPAARDGHWYTLMLNVGLVQGWPRGRHEALYKEGAGRHPDYYHVHFAAVPYYLPKWHGSPEAMRSFIDTAAAAMRARNGETLYARLQWAQRSNDMFQDGQANWVRMRAGFERIVTDHPDQWNLNNYLSFACQAGDAETIVRVSERIKTLTLAAWSGMDAIYVSCVRSAKINLQNPQFRSRYEPVVLPAGK